MRRGDQSRGLNWQRVKLFKGKPGRTGVAPAVELTKAEKPTHVILSHTTCVVREGGEVVPVRHLRDDFLEQYIELLEDSGLAAQKLRNEYKPRAATSAERA